MWRSSVVFFLLVLSALPNLVAQSGRPDFTRAGGGMPEEAMEEEQDTVQKPPLEFKYTLLSNLYKEYTDMDTSLNRAHLTDPYYEQTFIGGTIGPDLSAGYNFRYEGPIEGLRLGQEVHPLLSNLSESRFVQTNRPYFVVSYGTAQTVQANAIQAIKGDDFSMKFYKSFAQNIVLNFSYQSHTDKRATEDQDVSFKQLTLNLLQKNKSGNRTSYLIYDNPRYSDNYLDASAAINGNIENARRKLVFGNSIIFRDSTNMNGVVPRWDSQLELGKEAYRLTDDGIQTQELALYPYEFDTLNLSAIAFKNEINTLTLSNSYHTGFKGGEAMVGIDISRFSWTGLDTLGTSLYPITVSGSYSKKTSPYLSFDVKGRIGIVEASGDMGIEGQVNYILGKYRIETSLVAERLLPRLSQRGIFLNDISAQVFTNTFDPSAHIGISARLEIPNLKSTVEVRLDNYQDLILPNLAGQFEQENQSTRIIAFEAQTQISLGPFFTEHRFIFQNIDNSKLLRPELQYYGKLFLELNLFKKKMKSQWGVDVYFTPSFEIPTFWPVLGAFGYSTSPQNSGQILIVNPYLNLQVDKFSFFVKTSNVLDLIPTARDQNWVAGYPFTGNRVRFGLRWRLLD
ncbi:MAG: hypothetical protein ACI9FN_001919 [Saprospiraceae bacterium]|jgi:hypothetical protein